MAKLNEQEFKKEMASNELRPLYVIYGDEKYLVKKYESNATMLTLLQNYAEKQNEQSGGFAALWGYGEKSNAASAKRFFDTSILPTARGKRETLKQYADQAISIADNIGDFTPGRIGGGPDSPFLDAQIENFGADADF